jgi:hypothetical protein
MEHPINKIIVVLIFNGLFMGCSTFKEPVKNSNGMALTSENLNQLNGFYKRYSIENSDEIKGDSIENSDETKGDLFSLLFLFFKHEKGQYDMVELEVINNHRIKVSLLRNHTPIKAIKMRGRIRENTFEFKRRNIIIPFFPHPFTVPLVVGGYSDQKTRLRILPNGNLSADSKSTSYGLLMTFIPFSRETGEKSNIEFERIID